MNTNRLSNLSTVGLQLGLLISCLVRGVLTAGETATNRLGSWAQPLQLDGVPNLHQVTSNLFRSAQPTAQGMRNLKQKGITTVVNLRSFNSDRDEITGTGLRYEQIYMKAWHPDRKELVKFLRIVTDPKKTPVLVHCQHGADRTGAMCALYRVIVQGWTKEAALQEMTRGGFGFHEVWKNLLTWIEQLNIESVRKDAGITAGTGAFISTSATFPSSEDKQRDKIPNGSHGLHKSLTRELELVLLFGNQLSPKPVRDLPDQLETAGLVQVSGGREITRRPKLDFRVAGLPTERNRLFQEPFPKPAPPQLWVQKEPAKLRDCFSELNYRD